MYGLFSYYEDAKISEPFYISLKLDDVVYSYLELVGCHDFENTYYPSRHTKNIYDKNTKIWTYNPRQYSRYTKLFIMEIPFGYVDNAFRTLDNYRYSFIEETLVKYKSCDSIVNLKCSLEKYNNIENPEIVIITHDTIRAYIPDRTFKWTPTKEFLAFDKSKLHL